MLFYPFILCFKKEREFPVFKIWVNYDRCISNPGYKRKKNNKDIDIWNILIYNLVQGLININEDLFNIKNKNDKAYVYITSTWPVDLSQWTFK